IVQAPPPSSAMIQCCDTYGMSTSLQARTSLSVIQRTKRKRKNVAWHRLRKMVSPRSAKMETRKVVANGRNFRVLMPTWLAIVQVCSLLSHTSEVFCLIRDSRRRSPRDWLQGPVVEWRRQSSARDVAGAQRAQIHQ